MSVDNKNLGLGLGLGLGYVLAGKDGTGQAFTVKSLRDSEVSLSALRTIQPYHGKRNGVALRNCSIGPDKRNMS
ncbi:hypothetical protein VNO80_07957 [Phaseolus coccineus]|uniref:Uncharacterized protein n=1 Tax=Phaseolus coccineus TaxID=3886 RepID=A0AAN9NPD4_PHACN